MVIHSDHRLFLFDAAPPRVPSQAGAIGSASASLVGESAKGTLAEPVPPRH